MEPKIFMYAHGGSGNHGCEAIVRATQKMTSAPVTLLSIRESEDVYYGLKCICEIVSDKKHVKKYGLINIISVIQKRIFKKKNTLRDYYSRKHIFENIRNGDIALSIGGDNYCYSKGRYLKDYITMFNTKNARTILWGCSVEPKDIDKEMIEDLKEYSLITARESITYEVLKKINPNTRFYPDPAFQLNKIELPLPEGFIDSNTIGINISPLIIGYEQNNDTTMANFVSLLQHIIETTDMQIALIPHVIWDNNDDRVLLSKLYNRFKSTGRVVQIGDHNCMELKGFISHCRMFIGARTHATIAAYSTCVPTLVVGYSVKAKGIAKDIFGTYENYVIPVQSLEKEDDLIKAFQWLCDHENEIRTHLQEFMPSYIEKAWQAGDEIKKLLEEKNL